MFHVAQPFEFAGELANWFVNWFGELAVRSVSEFALDGIPLELGSLHRFGRSPLGARTLELVRELTFSFLLPPRPAFIPAGRGMPGKFV